MKYLLLHESKRRIRFHIPCFNMSHSEADIIEYYLRSRPYICRVKIHQATSDVTVFFKDNTDMKTAIFNDLEAFSFSDNSIASLVPAHTSREIDIFYRDKFLLMVISGGLRKLFLPPVIRVAVTILKSVKYVWFGLKSLVSGRLEVPVLDAAAIVMSLARGNFATASTIMFLLGVGSLLEEWTRKKSVTDLADAMSLNIEKVWKREGDADVLEDVGNIVEGDRIVVRTSNIIPFDGNVVSGEISVNQSSMTGESIPVSKDPGSYVYAGTVVEEGSCVIEVTHSAGTGKFDRIIKMIEDSEKLKSETEEKAFHLADRLVPYSLAGTVITWILTRNVMRAISFLMVDFSCSLKLSMPLSVLSAIKEAGKHDIIVKGGKFLEAAAQADTVVFDKTGTLTYATPSVVDIVTFGGKEERECLRLAACLEEHYPHSVANAIVNEAKSRKIDHEEMHSEVRYVVAHGISSEIDGKKAVIGSYHFVFEDENCRIPKNEEEKFAAINAEYSHLYLAIDGVLWAVICIFDPIREEAPFVINELYKLGISKICMLTGDNSKTAAAVARALNLSDYRSGVLPDDKLEYIRAEHVLGRKVLMIGDGINDTPALAEADAGIAIYDGAAIAKEISDIFISSSSLYQVVVLRKISELMMKRIRKNYRFTVSFNAGLIVLGLLGVLTPASSALLHNTSTIYCALNSMRDLIPEKPDVKKV